MGPAGRARTAAASALKVRRVRRQVAADAVAGGGLGDGGRDPVLQVTATAHLLRDRDQGCEEATETEYIKCIVETCATKHK